MILAVSPESSIVVRGAAATILFLHIAGGSVGILSGAAALVVRKGSAAHRVVGNIFFVSMLIMATVGAVVSPFLPTPQWANVVAGTFVFYLVTTSWATMKRSSIGRFERVALAVAVIMAIGAPLLGLHAINTPGHRSDEGASFVFAAIAALAASGDYRMIRRGGISGTPRLVRHLWRMCVALFIAAGSLFLGQPQLFSPAVHRSGILLVPELAVLGALVFWLIRVRIKRKPIGGSESDIATR